jgi:tRNA threonylcarbamoyl adenosine modification protein YeaZ
VILALDTSGEYTDVAVFHAGAVVAHCAEQHHYVAESVLELVDRAMREAGTDVRSLDAVAVCLGPGSFTGLRTGLATAVALEFGVGVPLWGVSTFVAAVANLLASENNAPEGERLLSVVQDANREELFTSTLSLVDGVLVEVVPPSVVPRESALHGSGERLWVGSDGTLSHGVARTVSLHLAQKAHPAGRGGFRWGGALLGEASQLQSGAVTPLYLKSVNALTLAERARK